MFYKLNNKAIRHSLLDQVQEISAQNVFDCYQCGNCSSGCPVVDYMDISPNQVMRLAQFGAIQEILDSETIWICSTCLQCSSRCPKGIDVSKVMEAFRAINLRKRFSKVEPNKTQIENIKETPPILLVSAMRKMTG